MAVIKELKSKGDFTTMSISQDEDEHSLEMHLPYIYAILSKYTLEVPVLTLGTSLLFRLLSQSWLDLRMQRRRRSMVDFSLPIWRTGKTSLSFQVISATGIEFSLVDWLRGSRFQYTYYNREHPRLSTSTPRATYASPPIYKAIEALDKEGMDLIAKQNYDAFASYLRETHNTICGRYSSRIQDWC